MSAAAVTSPNDSTAASIRVLIAVGVRLYREGLAQSLVGQPGISVVGIAADQASTVRSAKNLSPQVVLLDVGMDEGIACLRSLLGVAPRCRIIALALTEATAQILSYAEAGMAGYVTRDDSAEHLVATIRSVGRGEFLCSPRVAAALLQRVAEREPGPPAEAWGLTRRESQIAELIDQGLSNKEIAGRLKLETSTVKNHVHHILDKLNVSRRGQAVARLRSVAPARRI